MKWSSFVFAVVIASSLSLAGCKKQVSMKPKDSAGTAADSSSKDAPIRVVAFDEHDETLQGIIDGEVYGTVVQNPYMYGYGSIELLKQIADGTKKVDDTNSYVDYPARKIVQADAAAFWEEKKQHLKSGEGEPEIVAGRPTFAYVTNGIDPFWTVAAAGAKAAARELNVNVLLHFPPKGVADQLSILEDLLVQPDVVGIAVSPIDPTNQEEILNRVGEAKKFITHDSDAPKTNRLAYIGMDNYDAGRMAGQLVKEALPNGGKVMIFVGRLGQLNAELRRQGLIDELLDRPRDPTRRDPPDEVITGEKYTVLGTLTDGFDKVKAKQNAQDAISKYPDLGCMVGLFAYNPPLCLQAIQEAGRAVK